jgi:hypothetical protein
MINGPFPGPKYPALRPASCRLDIHLASRTKPLSMRDVSGYAATSSAYQSQKKLMEVGQSALKTGGTDE